MWNQFRYDWTSLVGNDVLVTAIRQCGISFDTIGHLSWVTTSSVCWRCVHIQTHFNLLFAIHVIHRLCHQSWQPSTKTRRIFLQWWSSGMYVIICIVTTLCPTFVLSADIHTCRTFLISTQSCPHGIHLGRKGITATKGIRCMVVFEMFSGKLFRLSLFFIPGLDKSLDWTLSEPQKV